VEEDQLNGVAFRKSNLGGGVWHLGDEQSVCSKNLVNRQKEKTVPRVLLSAVKIAILETGT